MSKLQELISRLTACGLGNYDVNYLIITNEACKSFGINSPTALIDALLEAVSDKVLIMNAFNWDFCRGKNYHFSKSICQTGLINEFFKRREGTVRGNHPIYSFIATGKNAQTIVEHDCETGWGPGSTSYKLLHDPVVRVITFGVPFTYRNTAMHVLEEKFQVPYRFYKKFKGIADFGNGAHDVQTSLYVKSLDDKMDTVMDLIQEPLREMSSTYIDDFLQLYAYDNVKLLEIGSEILTQNIYSMYGYRTI